MGAASAFQLWKDYFQLAKVVEGLSCGGPGRDDDDDDDSERPRVVEPRDQRQWPGPADLLMEEGGSEETFCSFCRHNGESSKVYLSHRLKDEAGKVQCPILRSYTCPQCGASQDTAHTRRFCPLTKKGYTSVYNNNVRNSAGKKKNAGSLEKDINDNSPH
ncbi:hypothetical protein JRQ81_003552 [Phrynocephalus forsythii]|uniref:Nanos-type domain-containing protein n=1 Tax=Phrynocephalus forsythii TaxID=171643 RepID=A0A9Q0XL14_9SAUR|nr:hypothetical protein JRQ81_003552 [Phrynocephalus forsythii]